MTMHFYMQFFEIIVIFAKPAFRILCWFFLGRDIFFHGLLILNGSICLY